MKQADLHCHTTYSDGHFKIEDVFKIAKDKVDYLAITDHDNLDSLSYKGNTYGITQIYGIELSTRYLNETIHVLGYFNKQEQITKEFKAYLQTTIKKRRNRAIKYICNLNKYYQLDLDFSKISHYKNITRTQIAKLISDKYHLSKEACFEKYLNDKDKAFIPSIDLDTIEGIKMLRESASIISIAHPCLVSRETLLKLLETLKNQKINIDALEAYYPGNKQSDTGFNLELCKKNHLLIEAGSDFHNLNESGVHGNIGTCTIQGHDLDLFLEKLRSK